MYKVVFKGLIYPIIICCSSFILVGCNVGSTNSSSNTSATATFVSTGAGAGSFRYSNSNDVFTSSNLPGTVTPPDGRSITCVANKCAIVGQIYPDQPELTTMFYSSDNGITWANSLLSSNLNKTYTFTGVSCVDNKCVAVGFDESSAVSSFSSTNNGQSWSLNNMNITGVIFNAVKCSSLGCLAVGEAGVVFYTEDLGTTWTQLVNNATTDNLRDVTCLAGPCMMVGDNGTILTYDGTHFSLESDVLTNQDLYGLNCNNYGCVVVGESGTILTLQIDGSALAQLRSGTTSILRSVACNLDSSTCIAVGDNGIMLQSYRTSVTANMSWQPAVQSSTGVPLDPSSIVYGVASVID